MQISIPEKKTKNMSIRETLALDGGLEQYLLLQDLAFL